MSQDNDDRGEIKFAPTGGLSYNPNTETYWNPEAMEKELLRTFELCHSCRLCFKYCQSFPTLFRAVDEAGGNVRAVSAADREQVVDECFQCKLCYTNCPYTEAEKHPYLLDFPRLMLRAKAIRARRSGIPRRERMLGDPDKLGRLGTRAAPLANFANRFGPSRFLLEKFMGVHREKLLPPFASQPFPAWIRARYHGAAESPAGEHPVVLFTTCFVNWNRPELGHAAVEVLEHNNCRIACPELSCCGMPALDGGDVDFARRQAKHNVALLLPFVERGYRIAVINPTCSLMMRQEYPDLLDDPADRALALAARRVAEATADVSEYLFELKRAGGFKTDFRSTPNGPVAYHAPCHLRKQNIGFRGRDLMRQIPGVQPKLVAECCGHDGTWAMKTEYFPLARVNGRKAFEGMEEARAEIWTTDCPLAAMQFQQMCGHAALHPVEVLARAYREDGFASRVPAPSPAPAAGEDAGVPAGAPARSKGDQGLTAAGKES